ncbi:MAG: hypothetical protein M1813_008948 [Trichoglossum hirsutum]|nr:MAG: hypothetical protein M1813_008948 [Trichoglossum hirsutum]
MAMWWSLSLLLRLLLLMRMVESAHGLTFSNSSTSASQTYTTPECGTCMVRQLDATTISWHSASPKVIVAATVLVEVDRGTNITSTTTVFNNKTQLVQDHGIIDPMTNADGTAMTILTLSDELAHTTYTVPVTYPSAYLSYPYSISVTGAWQTTASDGSKGCVTKGAPGSVIPLPSHPDLSRTFPAAIPTGGDSKGTNFVARWDYQGPVGRNVFPDVGPLQTCNVWDASPQVQLVVASYLTETSTHYKDSGVTVAPVAASGDATTPTSNEHSAAPPPPPPPESSVKALPVEASSSKPPAPPATNVVAPVGTPGPQPPAPPPPAPPATNVVAPVVTPGPQPPAPPPPAPPATNVVAPVVTPGPQPPAPPPAPPATNVVAPLVTPGPQPPAPPATNVIANPAASTNPQPPVPLGPAPAPPPITVGTNVIAPDSQNHFIIGTQTLTPGGPAITVSGTPISVPAVPAAPTALPAITVGGQAITPDSAAHYVIGSQTLVPGGPAITISGTLVSVPATPTVLKLPVLTFGGQTITADSATHFVIGSQTLVPGGPAITVSGTPISVKPGATDAVIGTSTVGLGNLIVSGFGGFHSPTASGNGNGNGSYTGPIANDAGHFGDQKLIATLAAICVCALAHTLQWM